MVERVCWRGGVRKGMLEGVRKIMFERVCWRGLVEGVRKGMLEENRRGGRYEWEYMKRM